MPRPLRPIDKGLIYHVINRGNNRQNVFDKPEDFEAFLRSMRDLKERRAFELKPDLTIRPAGFEVRIRLSRRYPL